MFRVAELLEDFFFLVPPVAEILLVSSRCLRISSNYAGFEPF
jgi:hypothetical protein